MRKKFKENVFLINIISLLLYLWGDLEGFLSRLTQIMKSKFLKITVFFSKIFSLKFRS